MAFPLIAAGISALGGVLGGVFSGNATKKANRENYNNSKEFWHMQNEYNTPLNQRKRLVEAGLNPALMYGGGGVSNVSSPARAPDVQPNQGGAKVAESLPKAVEAFYQYALMDKQKELIDSNIARNAQSVATAQKDIQLKDYQLSHIMPAQYSDIVARAAESVGRNSRASELHPYDLQGRQLTNNKISAEIYNTSVRTKGAELDNLAKEIRNSYLNEKEKTSLMLLMQNVTNAVLDGELKGQSFTNNEIRGLIDLEILKLRKEGFSPNDNVIIRRLNSVLQNDMDTPEKKNKVYRGLLFGGNNPKTKF